MGSKNFKTFGTNNSARVGIYDLNSYNHYTGASNWLAVGGQSEYLAPGTYSWTCPPGVTSVSAVCVGGGGGGGSGWANNGGGGGGLGWKNNISVTPGQSYTVFVGSKGNRGASNGQDSYFVGLNTVAGRGGNGESTGGSYIGDGGGNGGDGNSWSGGGGAGGYNGNGGASDTAAPQSSGAGAGGSYYSSTYGTGAGGGVGIYGIRTDYDARKGVGYGASTGRGGTTTARASSLTGLGGEGGSQRTGIDSGELTGYHGCNGENSTYGNNGNNIQGGFPGGGGGGPGTTSGGGPGADGAVRIMWAGETGVRSYPSTNCEDQ